MYSEPTYTQLRIKTDLPWYSANIDKHLIPPTRQLLEHYSGVPPNQQSKHVHIIRDQAWAVRTYPCTGLGIWLEPWLPRSPAYNEILKRLQAGETFLDVGCHLGADMRQLVFDGAPSNKMYGIDIASHWDVGFEMYRDSGRFDAQFIEADFLSDSNEELLQLKGQCDIISVSAVLHQWDRQDQVNAASRLVAFSRPGSLIVGHQIGNVDGHAVQNKTMKAPQWRHDPASFEQMWDQVGVDTGTRWQTKAKLLSWEDMGWDADEMKWMEPGDMVLDFVVRRMQ